MSEKMFSECAPVWLQKDMFISQNLKSLVTLKHLNEEQAKRVVSNDVKVGDPECMVYAANGLTRNMVSFYRNKEGQLVSKTVEYSCKNSQAKCPGIDVKIVDGRVADIRSMAK